MRFPTDEKAAIEFYESDVDAITAEPDGLIINLTAYVHRSRGIRGRDRGTGWMQWAFIRVRNGQQSGAIPELPCTLDGGDIRVGADLFDNIIPLPLSRVAATTISFLFNSGDWVQIIGDRLEITLDDEKMVG